MGSQWDLVDGTQDRVTCRLLCSKPHGASCKHVETHFEENTAHGVMAKIFVSSSLQQANCQRLFLKPCCLSTFHPSNLILLLLTQLCVGSLAKIELVACEPLPGAKRRMVSVLAHFCHPTSPTAPKSTPPPFFFKVRCRYLDGTSALQGDTTRDFEFWQKDAGSVFSTVRLAVWFEMSKAGFIYDSPSLGRWCINKISRASVLCVHQSAETSTSAYPHDYGGHQAISQG